VFIKPIGGFERYIKLFMTLLMMHSSAEKLQKEKWWSCLRNVYLKSGPSGLKSEEMELVCVWIATTEENSIC